MCRAPEYGHSAHIVTHASSSSDSVVVGGMSVCRIAVCVCCCFCVSIESFCRRHPEEEASETSEEQRERESERDWILLEDTCASAFSRALRARDTNVFYGSLRTLAIKNPSTFSTIPAAAAAANHPSIHFIHPSQSAHARARSPNWRRWAALCCHCGSWHQKGNH